MNTEQLERMNAEQFERISAAEQAAHTAAGRPPSGGHSAVSPRHAVGDWLDAAEYSVRLREAVDAEARAGGLTVSEHNCLLWRCGIKDSPELLRLKAAAWRLLIWNLAPPGEAYTLEARERDYSRAWKFRDALDKALDILGL